MNSVWVCDVCMYPGGGGGGICGLRVCMCCGYVYVQHTCAQVVICVHRCGMCVHRSCAWCMCVCGTVCEVCVNVSVCWSIKPEG